MNTEKGNQTDQIISSKIKNLRVDEKKLSSILDNIPDLILQLDQAGKILFANRKPQWSDHNEYMGSNFFDYVHAEDSKRLMVIHKRIFRKNDR